MFRHPSIVIATALAKPVQRGCETNQWYKQDFRDDRPIADAGLQDTVRSGLEVAFAMRIVERCKRHWRIGRIEPGQGDHMPCFVKETRIGRGWRFVGVGVVKPDHRILRNTGKQRRRRPVKQQAADRGWQGLDMRFSRGAKRTTEFGFGCHAFFSFSQRWANTT